MASLADSSDTKMKSLSVEGVAVVAGVANGHRGVGNSADRGKGSRGDNWGSSVGESGVTNNDSKKEASLASALNKVAKSKEDQQATAEALGADQEFLVNLLKDCKTE